MRKFWILMFISLLWTGLALAQDDVVITRQSAPDPASIKLTPIVDGLNRPLFIAPAGDASGRLFVVEQSGKIWILKDGEKLATPFLDVSSLISPEALTTNYSERGLLGLAFHPDYAENGRFFINYTDTNGGTVLARYQASVSNPDIADASSAEIIFQISQPFANHNGGNMAFGPDDGYLYMSLGDGGSANDPLGSGQNPLTLLGSIIRIDVDNGTPYGIPEDNPFAGDKPGADEIWVYGLRNTWRFSFDRATYDMYIADVGQNAWEEVNFQSADSPGGENYGWNVWEGTHPFARGNAPGHVLPFAEYSHAEGCSVTGGYVYRGSAIPSLTATYLFGDYCSGNVWASYRDENLQWHTNKFLQTGMSISSFGQDEDGELYIVNYSGVIYRIDPA